MATTTSNIIPGTTQIYPGTGTYGPAAPTAGPVMPSTTQKTSVPAVITASKATEDVNKARQTADQASAALAQQKEAQANAAALKQLQAEQAAQAAKAADQAALDTKIKQMQLQAEQSAAQQRGMTVDDYIKMYGDQGAQTPTSEVQPQPSVQPTAEVKPASEIQEATNVYTAGLQANNAKTDQSYEQYKNQLEQFQNGTFPLTADQQAIVDATKAMAEQVRGAQLLANKNYEAGVTQAGISSGMQRYSPDVYFGNIQSAVSAGLQKVAELDSQAALELANLKQGFQSNNLKLVQASYEAYNNYIDKKNQELKNIYEATTSAAKDARDFAYKIEKDNRDYAFNLEQTSIANDLAQNKFDYQKIQDKIANDLAQGKFTEEQAQNLRDYTIKLKQLEQGKYSVTTDAFGRPAVLNTKTGQIESVSSSGDIGGEADGIYAPQNKSFYDAFQNASLGLTAQAKTQMLGQINNLLSQGDYKGAQETMTRIATQTATADQKNAAMGRTQAISAMNDILSILNTYVSKSGDTNIWKGSLENALNKIGLSKDESLVKLGGALTIAMQNYRNAITGKAFSDKEIAEYKKFIPNISDTSKLSTAKIQGFVNALNTQQKAFIGSQIGESNYDKIFPPAKYTDLTSYYNANPEQHDMIEQMIQDGNDPNDILEYLQMSGLETTFNQPLSMGVNGSNVKKIASAIGQFESGGNYQAVGPQTGKMGKAIGKYQIMEANIPNWTKEALGKSMTVEEFKNNPQAQDAVAEYKMKQYYDKYGTLEDVASAWFSGQPLAKAGNAKDVIGTSVPKYVQNVRNIYNKLG